MTTPSPISDREREILRLVATGATNQQIAQQLNISVNTVKVHLRNIFGKTGVASRAEATLYAVRMGLVPLTEAAELTDTPIAVADEPLEAPDIPPPAAQAALVMQPAGVPAGEPIVVAPPAQRHGRLFLLLAAAVVALLLLGGAALVITRPRPPAPLAGLPAPGASAVVPSASWRELAQMQSGRFGFALAGFSADGRDYLYAIGGEVGGAVSNQVIRYDVTANTWVTLSPKPTAVSDVRAVRVGNRIYVPGGKLPSGKVADTFEAYDPKSDSWTELKPLPMALSGYALATVDGKIYLFGGWDGASYRAEVWQYNPDTNEWSRQTPMRTARAFADAAVLADQVYLIGGEDQRGPLALNERYTPAEEGGAGSPWATKAPLPFALSRMAIATAGSFVFALGGASTEGQPLIYDPSNDKWQAGSATFGALRDLRAQAIGNKLYLFGGRDDAATSARAYEYQATYTVLLPFVPNE